MIWQLIKVDVAWRFVKRTAILFGAFAAVWHFVAHHASHTDRSGVTLFLMFFAPLFSLGVTPLVQPVDTRFQATLPVTVRQVFAARMLSTIALQWLPVVTGAIILTVLSGPGLSGMPLLPWSVVTCIVLGIQCGSIRGFTIRRALAFLAAPILLFILDVAAVALDWPLQNSLAWYLAPVCCWLLTAVVVARTWRLVPAYFQLPSAEAQPAPSAFVADNAPSNSRRLVFANIVSPHPAWIVCFVIVGMLAASNWAYQIGLLWVPLGALWESTRSKTRWLVVLPVPPRRLLASILLPALLAVTVGYELGLRIPRIADTLERGVVVTANSVAKITNISKDCKMFNVIPPLEFRVRAQADHAPLIRAPWGETFQPAINSFYGFDVYNPYASNCDNSERFLDWQFARATTAVYGQSIPRDLAAGSYVVISQLAIPRIRKHLVTIGVMAFCLMLAMLATTLEDWYRLRRIKPVLRRIVCLLASLLFMVLFILFNYLCQWLSWALPSNPFGALAAALAALALIYWPLDAMFRQLEFEQKPVRSRL